MENILKPERFACSPDTSNASKQWKHWYQTFTTFIESSKVEGKKKLGVLVNFLSYDNYEFISECKEYKDAIRTLQNLFIPKKNILFARHLLANLKQQEGESIDHYLQALKTLSKDCEFENVDSKIYSNESIRDAFISGINSSQIRQRILEHNVLTLEKVEEIARSLESAQKHADAYSAVTKVPQALCLNVDSTLKTSMDTQTPEEIKPTTAAIAPLQHRFKQKQKCYFCGGERHVSRAACPARDAVCKGCLKTGHFVKVCLSKHRKPGNVNSTSSATTSSVITSAVTPTVLSKAIISGNVNSIPANCLIDTGSSDSFIDSNFVFSNHLKTFPEVIQVSMASTSLVSPIKEHVIVDLKMKDNFYKQVKLLVIEKLCTDVLIGHDIMKLHTNITVGFGGPRPPFSVCNVACANVEPPQLFEHMTKDCRPIATRTRRFFGEDEKFIQSEIHSLLKDDVIEASSSPWRAQVLITKNENHKKRLVIDYSQTVNKFTLLDAYPLPEIETLVSKVARYDTFSSLDLSSAYHQIPILEHEKKFTAFEADGQLYQFKRIPFGVTNGVSAFQRTINKIISDEGLEGTFAYIDDVTIGGIGKHDHDKNLNRFMEVAKKYNLTLNLDKCSFSQDSISILGYQINNKTVRPDPNRLQPLLDMPLPRDAQSLKRMLGLFAYYSKWVPKFSDKIRTLVSCKVFPIKSDSPAASDFETIKNDIANSFLVTIEPGDPLTVETDASGVAIAATLTQNGRPVAFFSRTLSETEKQHSTVEREAQAIIESIKKWKHFLLGRHFLLMTDQKALSFIFDQTHSSRIKNDKILRWRLELSPFSYDVQYRPGKENVSADALSRICNASATDNRRLFELHQALCHPGITRFYHWIRSKNLPYSLNDIKTMILSCPICSEVKPRFFKQTNTLIKATAPFERLNIDFKGPLPSSSKNRYMLDIIDEYSRFPFSYPCKDMTSSTVIECLENLFSLFGIPSYIHSDRGKSFLSDEIRTCLHQKGVATSLTSPYNPAGNGQIERYNGIIWKAVTLSLKSKGMDHKNWESVLPEALHSIRSLLCTATNCTPHERFFIHPRRSTNGSSLPAWLLQPGPVLARRNVRNSKYEPLVDEVELIEANPQYALVRHVDGRESSVSLKHLAPRGDKGLLEADKFSWPQLHQTENEVSFRSQESTEDCLTDTEQCNSQKKNLPRRSTRTRKASERFKDYVS